MEQNQTPDRPRRRSPYQRSRRLQGQYLSWLLVGTVALFAVLSLLGKDREFSESENRKLAQFPELSVSTLADGSFLEGLGDYAADQFPGRDTWISMNLWMNETLGQKEVSGVYLCEDGYLMQVPGEPNETQLQRNLKAISAFGKRHEDLNIVMSVIPNAVTVLSGKLPENAPVRDQIVDLVTIKTGVEHVNFVDATSAMSSHNEEDLFFRTDHHWTSLGAYYGYAAILEAMGMEPQPLGQQVTVSDDFNGTLYSTSGVHWLEPDEIHTYVPDNGDVYVTANTGEGFIGGGLYVPEKLEGKDKYTYFLGGNQPLYIIENPNAATDKKLLVLRDSYADSLAPFLSQDFAEIHLLDLRYYRTPVAAYAEQMGADAILVSYSVDNFQKDENIIFMGQ